MFNFPGKENLLDSMVTLRYNRQIPPVEADDLSKNKNMLLNFYALCNLTMDTL